MCYVLLNLLGISIKYICIIYDKFYNKINEERGNLMK